MAKKKPKGSAISRGLAAQNMRSAQKRGAQDKKGKRVKDALGNWKK